MARRPPPPPQSLVKRRSDYEDWMDEDDFLDRGFSERDLRHKLQRGGGQPDQVRVLERDTGISTARSSNLRDSTARSGQISTEREGARGLSTLMITEMLDPGKEIGRVLKGSTSLVLI